MTDCCEFPTTLFVARKGNEDHEFLLSSEDVCEVLETDCAVCVAKYELVTTTKAQLSPVFDDDGFIE